MKHITEMNPEQWKIWQDRVDEARQAFRKQVMQMANEIQQAKEGRQFADTRMVCSNSCIWDQKGGK